MQPSSASPGPHSPGCLKGKAKSKWYLFNEFQGSRISRCFPGSHPSAWPQVPPSQRPLGEKQRLPWDPWAWRNFWLSKPHREEAVRFLENWSDFPGQRPPETTQNPPEKLDLGAQRGEGTCRRLQGAWRAASPPTRALKLQGVDGCMDESMNEQMTPPTSTESRALRITHLSETPGPRGNYHPTLPTGKRQRHSTTWKLAPVHPPVGGKARICILVSLYEFYAALSCRCRGGVKGRKEERGEGREASKNLPLNT